MGFFFFKCRSAMALRSVLLIQIGKQNVKIIDKEIEKSKNELSEISYILTGCLPIFKNQFKTFFKTF